MLKKTGLLFGFFCIFYSCDETIFVADISNEVVHILAPTNGTEIAADSISFNWNPVGDATEYQIQIATPNFDQAVQIVAEQNTTTTSFTIELATNDYQWRVRALNSAYETTYTTISFSVQ